MTETKQHQIIFIRHGEKTKDDPVHLSHEGIIRAKHIAHFFEYNDDANLQKPDCIIAMKQNSKDSSNRPYETVQPLSISLNIPILAPFTRDKIDQVVDLILHHENKNQTVLICWEHKALVEIVELFLHKRYASKHTKHGMHLNWGANPLSGDDDADDFSSIWIIDTTLDEFVVYKQFDLSHSLFHKKLIEK